MKLLSLVVVVVSLFGCLADDTYHAVGKYKPVEGPRMATVSAWELLVGRVGDKCYERAQHVDVLLVETFPNSCGAIYGGRPLGCYLRLDYRMRETILIRNDISRNQKKRTLAHEYIHLLQWCEEKGLDLLHEDRLLWEDYGDETVEAVAWDIMGL